MQERDLGKLWKSKVVFLSYILDTKRYVNLQNLYLSSATEI